MKMHNFFYTAGFIALLSLSVFSADRWPSYISFTVGSPGEARSLSAIVSIDKVTGNTVFAYATIEEMRKLDSLGYAIRIIAAPPAQKKQKTESDAATPMPAVRSMALAGLSSYPTYSEYIAMMYQFAAGHPSLCSIENAGSTVNGHSLLIARVSSNAPNAAKPNVFFAGNIHGDETGGIMLMLKLIDHLLTNYGSNPRITAILDNVVLYVNPSANPDGLYYYGDNTICDDSHPDCYLCRFNGNGVDLNRDMPMIPDNGSAVEPENQAMINFFNAHRFALSVDYHAGREQAVYPWFGNPDVWPPPAYSLTADNDWYVASCQQYAQAVQAYGPAGYFRQHDGCDPNIPGIDNAYSVYIATGTREDYMNYWHRGRGVVVETAYNKYLPENQIDNFWNYHREAMLGYIELARKGIQGVITDASTGQPLLASIEVTSHDASRSGVWSDPANGFYKRLIAPGTWNLVFRAPGYTSTTRSNVTVVAGQATTLNVALSKVANPPGFFVRKNGSNFFCLNQTVGNMSIPGISQTSPFKGMIFKTGNPAAAVDNSGNFTCNTVNTSQGSFLDNSNNLVGGIVIRDNNRRAVAHVSAGGTTSIRGGLLPGFSIQ